MPGHFSIGLLGGSCWRLGRTRQPMGVVSIFAACVRALGHPRRLAQMGRRVRAHRSRGRPFLCGAVRMRLGDCVRCQITSPVYTLERAQLMAEVGRDQEVPETATF